MIGYSKRARSQYHRGEDRSLGAWAKCDTRIRLPLPCWADSTEGERLLLLAKPHLTRCPRCFGKKAK